MTLLWGTAIRKRLQLIQRPDPRPPFQDVLLVRVQQMPYDWARELDGGVR
jgi:hypothetical protein